MSRYCHESIEDRSPFPPGYYDYAKSNLASQQNTSGLPTQFFYLEAGDRHPNHSQKEQTSINLAPYSDVAQNSQKDPIVGRYDSMVYDTPFDPIHDRAINSNLTMFGLGFTALAIAFF